MVNTCVVQGCIVCTAKQNVTLHEFPKQRARRSLWRRFVQTTRSLWEPTHHSHVCSQHVVSPDFVNDVEYRRATQRNESSARLLYRQFFHQNCLIRNAQSADSEATYRYRSVRVLRLILLLLHTFSQCRWCSWWLVHVWF